MQIISSREWAEQRVAGFPARWRKRLLSSWLDKARPEAIEYRCGGIRYFGETPGNAEANSELREITDILQAVRLTLDASDADICARAEELARECLALGSVFHQIEELRAAMSRKCEGFGVVPPAEKVKDRPAILRMTDALWWRRGLRKMHAKAVEGAAIQLGYVNRARDIYVSNESLARCQQQNRRNAAMMENTIMRNELSQEYKLAELAALGTGNKAIRRGELMTRIAGLERIARDCGHAGLFLTGTCPSRMHKFISAGGGKVYPNRKYDGTTPREAQEYMVGCGARIRARLARHGIKQYGFRIAEPHHDGCPHWHLLIFCEPWAKRRIVQTYRHYMLEDSPEEAGARKHRVTCEVIDWSRGTAAGYIAKYVAKNIDGLHVGEDLLGNPAMETSQKVEAWARTWGIRQFQPIGGAPIGVWRELRRIKELPEGAPEHLKAAHRAANKIEGEQAADFGAYVMAQGGPLIGRDYKIRLAKAETGEVGRYGEVVAPRPVGVESLWHVSCMVGAFVGSKVVPVIVESVRYVWEVVRRAARSAAPRTRVNNCTRRGEENAEAGGATGRSRAEFQPKRSGKDDGGGYFPSFDGIFAGDAGTAAPA